nr:MAG TPA: hypothetical protein [Microviridae sp.]
MNTQNSLFKRSFNKTFKTYSVSFRGLSNEQANLIEYLFKNLTSEGVVMSRMNGFTVPSLMVTSVLPLSRGVDNTLVIPNSLLNDIVSNFGSKEFSTFDELVSYNGKFISNYE